MVNICYYFPGQAAQDSPKDRQLVTGNLGLVDQCRWHRTGSPVQVALERQLETGSLGQVDQCRLAQVRQPGTGSPRQAAQDSQPKKGCTGQPAQKTGN